MNVTYRCKITRIFLQEVTENVIEFGNHPKVYYGLSNRPPQNSKHYLAFMFPSITHMYSLILCIHPIAQDFFIMKKYMIFWDELRFWSTTCLDTTDTSCFNCNWLQPSEIVKKICTTSHIYLFWWKAWNLFGLLSRHNFIFQMKDSRRLHVSNQGKSCI